MTRNYAQVSLIVRKSLEFFCKQTRIGIILTRKADPDIFLITLKQGYCTLMLNMLNFPILCDLFPFSMFYCANEGKMFNFKGVTQRDAD